MAATYTDPNKKKEKPVTTAAAQPAAYSGLKGLSEGTGAALGKYSQGYQASDAVTQAQSYLNNVVAGKPADYQSQYKGQLDSLYQQVMSRPQFSYDLGSDMLYQQYKDQYTNLGRNAMQDTVAQASALTGGYGNSYAATAGSQAYQNYLQQLNNMVPELYQAALNRYTQEGNDLMTRYGMVSDLENQEYGRYRDSVTDWQNEREFANTDYWNQYNADYSNYQTMLNYYSQLAQQENADYNTNREMALNQAMAIIQTGNMPSASLLKGARLSSENARKLVDFYKKKVGSSGGGGGGGGGGGRSGSGGGSSGGNNSENSYQYTDAEKKLLNWAKNDARGKTEAGTEINRAAAKGTITATGGKKIKQALGL